MRPQHVRRHQRVGEVDLAAGRQRTDQEFDQPHRAVIGAQEIPVTVDRDRRIRLLLRHDVVETLADVRQLRRRKIGFSPHRGVTGGHQQRIVLAQRNVERSRDLFDHRAAGLRAAELQEAQVALRDAGALSQCEL